MDRRLFLTMMGGAPLAGLPALAQSETGAVQVIAPEPLAPITTAPATSAPATSAPVTSAAETATSAAPETAGTASETIAVPGTPPGTTVETTAPAPKKVVARAPIKDPAPRSSWPIAQRYYPVEVNVRPDLPVGSIIIVSDKFFLYHIVAPGKAMRYGVAVGRDELKFRGTAVVARKVRWPTWTPTPDMIKRNPKAYEKYKDGMPGGYTNPLGARAMYLYQDGRDTAIRIHGTTEPSSIGHAVSNGCLRMVNDHVIALFDEVPVGTKVTVY